MKILILAAVFGLAVLFVRSWIRLLQFKAPERTDNNQTDTRRGQMIACEKCRLHVPLETAVELNGKFYCCREHAKEQ